MDCFLGDCDQPGRDCFRSVPCSTLRLGTASGLLRRPALAKLLLYLWHRSGSGSPLSGPPEKQLLVLGAAPTRFRVPETKGRTGETYVPLGFLGSDAEKKVRTATNIAVFSLATKTSWKNDAGTW
jgi:hypothetical protein